MNSKATEKTRPVRGFCEHQLPKVLPHPVQKVDALLAILEWRNTAEESRGDK
jgi:hypothetical protein